MLIYNGTNLKNMTYNGQKVKKWNHNGVRVFSAGSTVTYCVDNGISYIEEVDSEASCLSPQTFTPVKNGWTFVGWKEDTTANSNVLPSKVMGDTPITLYAVFQSNVTITKYNGSNNATTETKQKYYNNGNTSDPSFTLTQNAISGWSAAGWTTSSSGYSATLANGGSVTLSNNATYYSLYTQGITITKYNASNTATTETKNRIANYHSSVTYSNPSFTLSQSAISGWTSAGWTTSASGYSATVANGGSVTLTANATYYSLYTTTVTVTCYNGSNTASTISKTRIANIHSATTYSNPSFTLSQNAISGWAAAGWTTSTGGYSATLANGGSVSLSSNATYYSLYTASVTVTYYNNTTAAATTTKTRIANIHNVTTYSNPSFTLTQSSKSGWVARGWSTSSSASASISYSNGATITATGNITLYGCYQQTITLSYAGNGATSGSVSAQTGTRYFNSSNNYSNPSFTISSNGFAKTNYTFLIWALGSTSGTHYAAGSSITLSASNTLYALWKANPWTLALTSYPIKEVSRLDATNVAISTTSAQYYLQVRDAGGSGAYGRIEAETPAIPTKGCNKVRVKYTTYHYTGSTSCAEINGVNLGHGDTDKYLYFNCGDTFTLHLKAQDGNSGNTSYLYVKEVYFYNG